MQKCSVDCSAEESWNIERPEPNPDVAGVGVCIIPIFTRFLALLVAAEA